MRKLKRITLGLSIIALSACNYSDLPEDEPCTDVGYAIAARLFACTQSEDRANDALIVSMRRMRVARTK